MNKLERGQIAEGLLQNPVLQEAFNNVKQQAIDVFLSGASSEEEIMDARRMVRALERVEQELSAFKLDAALTRRREEREQHRGSHD